jgi:hypothetical protein
MTIDDFIPVARLGGVPLKIVPYNEPDGTVSYTLVTSGAGGAQGAGSGGSTVNGPGSSEVEVAVGVTIPVSDEFTGVSDANIYAVGDCIGETVSDTNTTPLRSIVVGAVNGSTGYLTKFRLETDQVACIAQIRAHFFKVPNPTTAIPGDNVSMKLSYANRAQRIGSIDFPALATTNPAGASDAAKAHDMTTRLAFACALNDNKIYYRLETLTIFTHNNPQHWYLELTSERNGA